MHKHTGFTLIELVIVIVIIGILAVIAAPRFINVSRDANIASLQGMQASLLAAGQLVYAKSVIQSAQQQALASVDIDNDGIGDIETEYGYPSGSRSNGITLALGNDFARQWAWSSRLSPQRIVLTTASLSTNGAGQKVNNVPITTNNCYLTYIGPTAPNARPTITLTTTGC